MKEATEQLAQQAADMTDDLIVKAIAAVDEFFTLEDVRRFAEIVITPDKRETICWKGQPIMELFPPEYSSTVEGGVFKVTCTRQYRALNKHAANAKKEEKQDGST